MPFYKILASAVFRTALVVAFIFWFGYWIFELTLS